MTKRDYSDWKKEALIKRIEGLEKRKKYGLVWDEESTKEEFEEESRGKLPVLVEDKSKEIHTDDDQPTHILIEGDNYHALSVLNYTHESKIDVIYIDPPYNTGKKKEWKYNDKWVDKEDAYRHSKWLSFMEKRLELAKSLISIGGVIFISIDDNEFAQLRLLCNEIFTDTNFLGTITWEKRTKAQNTKTAREMLQSKTEYILVYKSQVDKMKFNLEASGEQKYDLQDKEGLYREKKLEEMSARGIRGRKTMVFPIKGISPREGFQWKLGQDKINEFLERNDIEIKNDRVFLKIRPKDETKKKFIPFWSHFFDKDTYGTAEKGKSELTKILGTNKHDFETVKPLNLIKKILFHINKEKMKLY